MARTTLPAQADEAQAQPQTPQATQASSSSSPPWSPPRPRLATIVRIISLAFLVLSVSLLASNSTTIRAFNTTTTFHFNYIYAYRYALATAVIGLSYTSLHLLSSIQQVTSGKTLANDPKFLVYEFLGDKVVWAVVATGVGAAFGATVDLKTKMDEMEDAFELYLNTTIFAPLVSKFDDFFNRAYIAAIFLLIAFLTTGLSSVLSSLALINKNT